MSVSVSEPLIYRPNDRQARLIGVPLVSIIMHFTFHEWRGFDVLLGKELIIDFLFTISFWEGVRQIWFRLSRLFPLYTQTKKRIFLLTISILVYAFLATITVKLIASFVLGDNFVPKMGLWKGFLVSLVPTFMITSVYESTFFFWAWRTNVQKTEALARENVQSQLETLKNQLDPHFLFNSLNTLASLIEDDNTPAQVYLERLSDVYRYVLVSREKNTVTLEEEMQFIDAYVYLNKIRFRENLQVEMAIESHTFQQHVAPLSVQMLIENAIKHNIVSQEKPLKIRILSEGNFLTVENNLQEKNTFEKSTKVGLQNIINRYRLLTEYPIDIIKNDLFFKVRLPLLP